ncbi:hypothetical protein DV515_00008591 [Chloebia gouldiae]|uniref:Uncharacterized protein n=1 Tax=Chloebia gouldiae TaxID=44316 RepID=A0A3L8SEA0_CHLGU|nr:hypothetical protein DV515_00008591 [Chloebia gouldiae]
MLLASPRPASRPVPGPRTGSAAPPAAEPPHGPVGARWKVTATHKDCSSTAATSTAPQSLIVEGEEKLPTKAKIMIRKQIYYKSSLIRLYHAQELVATQLEPILNFQFGAWGLRAKETKAQEEESWVGTHTQFKVCIEFHQCLVFSELELRPLFFPSRRIPQVSLQLSGIKPHGCKIKVVQTGLNCRDFLPSSEITLPRAVYKTDKAQLQSSELNLYRLEPTCIHLLSSFHEAGNTIKTTNKRKINEQKLLL